NDNTKLLWIETPTNPLLRIVDIEELATFASNHDMLSLVDNTFASPYLQRPLNLGADIVLHSTTKYLGGHSDIVGGAVATSNEDVMQKLRIQVKTTGAVPGPMDCYLTLRGIKTLSVRMDKGIENAKVIAGLLETHQQVEQVYLPGLESHAQHELAKSQMDDFAAMISFTFQDDDVEKAQDFTTRTHFFALAESLGGVASL